MNEPAVCSAGGAAERNSRAWRRTPIDGLELECVVQGSGAPVLLIHAGVCADFFVPLLAQPALAEDFRLICYHRVGYAGSTHPPGPVSIAAGAAHAATLLRQLGIARAHIVGHSSSAMMALQLALDTPQLVQSLALLDAARPAPESEIHLAFVRDFLQPAVHQYRAGDPAAAIDTFMRGVCGPGYRAALERALPGAFAQAVADADTFFGQELPAIQEWTFTQADAIRVDQPVLLALGERSRPTFRERQELLRAWLPNAELVVLPGATHLLQVENPGGMAAALRAFFARHPIPCAL